jgi:molybdopterin-binding protein
MSDYRLGEAAEILGFSTDKVRRLADAGTLKSKRTRGRQRLIDGKDLARYAAKRAPAEDPESARESARNRFPGIVVRVKKDKVSAQVEIRAGRFRVVSLITREAVESLGLKPGVAVSAVVKATNVVVERPR